ncbi:hypothetical protein Q3G72_013243 [Acer saccharum]|nr:hypothetical protein Q3G72_013243 [Acer saccharum]
MKLKKAKSQRERERENWLSQNPKKKRKQKRSITTHHPPLSLSLFPLFLVQATICACLGSSRRRRFASVGSLLHILNFLFRSVNAWYLCGEK